MIKVVVAVRDSAMDSFMQPWYVPTNAVAVRAFQKEVNNPQSPMHDTPSDYELYKIGMFNEETGEHENLKPPERLTRAKDMKNETTDTFAT